MNAPHGCGYFEQRFNTGPFLLVFQAQDLPEPGIGNDSSALGRTDCFEESVLDKHGLLRAGERVKVAQNRALLYGPAINASSYADVALAYLRMMSILCGVYNYYVPYPTAPQQTIAAVSDFTGDFMTCLASEPTDASVAPCMCRRTCTCC